MILTSHIIKYTEQVYVHPDNHLLKSNVAISVGFQLCSARYTAFKNEEEYEKWLCNQSSHYGNCK